MKNERHVLIVFPHPDDESYCVAGTILAYVQRNVPLTYVCLTLGEMGRAMGNPPFATRESLYAIREKELKRAAKNGISASTLWYRVYDLYWDKEVAISKSPQRATEWRSVKETALRNGISRNAFNKRRRRGWNLIDSITKPPMSREEALKRANQCNRKYSKLTEEQIQIFKSNGLKPSTVYMRIRKLKWE
ncbi:PIG-L family deacetylase, partial [Bacillus sp. HC-Mk]